jgi:hypothetical protein
MSSYVTNKFVSRIDEHDFDVAISKLSYEIQQRKKEFISLCAQYDPKYRKTVSTKLFSEILNKFTVYPGEFEKKLIISKIAVDDKYIDYINLTEYPRIIEEPYQDIFLQHLNDERFKKYYQQKNIIPSSSTDRKEKISKMEENDKDLDKEKDKDNNSDISNDFNLSPIEILNAEINEENFLRKVSKDLMTYILTHTKGERPKEFTQKLFKKFDFDGDNKYTIGEFNNFLMYCELVLGDADLRFFYENFPVIDGRVNIEQINDFIEKNSEKNFENLELKKLGESDKNDLNFNFTIKNVEEKLEAQKNYKKKKEDERIIDMTNKNYLTNVIKDCLLIFGREYLYKYLFKYFFNFGNKPYIEDNNLIVGLCSFGFKMPSTIDIENFKYICLDKNIAKVRGLGTSVILDIQGLFDFVINFFEIEETIKNRSNEDLINSMGKAYCDKINESFLTMVTDFKNKIDINNNKNQNEINIENKKILNKKIQEYLSKSIGEKDFRKKFINNFGFIDHQFFENQIHEFCCEEIKSEKNFNPNLINIKKFVNFSYNFLFLYMIKNYKSLGIMLDSSSHKTLTELYQKIKSQIFPDDNNNKKAQTQNLDNKAKNEEINNTNNNIFTTELSIQNNNYNLKSIPEIKDINMMSPREEQKNDINSNDKINSYVLNKTVLGSVKINEEYKSLNSNNKYKTMKPSTRIINTDPIEAIPVIYNICVKYIINLFKLDRVSFNLLKGIGVCKIFRDYLNKNRGKKNTIHWKILIQNLENIVPEVGINFLKKIALDNKDTDGNINLQFYFSKIEQILLQYCLSLEDEKNFAKYYI